MGLLDKIRHVMDVQLTDAGRELLSKGQLDFAYYAFFDDGIDYAQDEATNCNSVFSCEAMNTDRTCKCQLGTVEPTQDEHLKPQLELSMTSVTMKKVQQEGTSLGQVSLVGVVDVFVVEDEPQYETAPPIYRPALDLQSYVPIVADFTDISDVPVVLSGEDFPEEGESTIDLQNPPLSAVISVHQIDKSQDITFTLKNAVVRDGFRIEVFYSGSATITGSENGLIKLTERGLDPTYLYHYGSQDATPPDVRGGYNLWFRIKAE